jgi:hypothetical protein
MHFSELGVTVGLSEREQKLLDELERGLYASDSNLAHKLGKPGAKSPRRMIAGGALVVIGLSLLVVAVMLQFALFGVVGFISMLVGLVVATSSNPGLQSSAASKPAGPSSQSANPSKKSFFDDRWDKRQGL